MMDAYEKFFREADSDGDGNLSYKELTSALRKHGYKGSDKQIMTFFHAVDTSGDKYISFEEYMVAMQKIPSAFHRDAVLRKVFRSFDKDGNGEIDRTELKQVFAKMGKQLTEDQLTEVMKLVDTDGSGSIDYEEFIASLDSTTRNSQS